IAYRHLHTANPRKQIAENAAFVNWSELTPIGMIDRRFLALREIIVLQFKLRIFPPKKLQNANIPDLKTLRR
ncbi:MAG: hypothetical protein KDE06_00855, partial [Rhodobacteraceae bacterium]|nr:hypothetical protein [Paracoccaceae bacterium]